MAATSRQFDFSARQVADELDRVGFVQLEDAVDADWLERARADVKARIDQHGQRFFSIVRPADEEGAPAREMTHDPALQRLMAELTALACPKGIEQGGRTYNVLRIIAGPKADEGSLLFHYDASVVTALVPIFMPTMGRMKSGELIVFANRRPFRSSLILNLAEKLVSQNPWSRRRARRALAEKPDSFVQILYPGSIYLFWGYRTYHGNLACAPNALRATLLLHYGNPHGNSLILRSLRFGRRLVESVRLRFS